MPETEGIFGVFLTLLYLFIYFLSNFTFVSKYAVRAPDDDVTVVAPCARLSLRWSPLGNLKCKHLNVFIVATRFCVLARLLLL